MYIWKLSTWRCLEKKKHVLSRERVQAEKRKGLKTKWWQRGHASG